MIQLYKSNNAIITKYKLSTNTFVIKCRLCHFNFDKTCTPDMIHEKKITKAIDMIKKIKIKMLS